MTGKHTLEKIVDEIGKDFDDDKLHTAMLLSYTQAIYSVVRRNCVPSPLYRLAYDEKNNAISMIETYGLSFPPERNALDISVLDEIFCCNIRDIPLLLEGETGTGKTYTSMKYLSTILEKEQYFSNRLSANAFLNNLFSYFQEGKMINGMPVITARTDKIENCAAGLTDEINRGDSNETLQLFDNEMHLSGKIYKLGIPIPKIKNGKYIPDSGRRKDLLLVCAQNPAGTEDAKFTQTMELDAAVDNRLLKIYVGNASSSAGSTLWLGNEKKKLHNLFLEDFKKRLCDYLNIPEGALSKLKEDWISTYAWITESDRTDKPILYSALELSDLMITTFSGDLINYYNYEKNVLNYWGNYLKKDIRIDNNLNKSKCIEQIHEVTNSFKVPMIFRDIIQIKKIADVLATLRNIKDALKSDDSLNAYLNTKRYVTVREVAGATSLLARNKQTNKAISPINSINQVLQQYVGLVEDYLGEVDYMMGPSFDLFNPNIGIKKIGVYKSIRDTIMNSGNVDHLMEKIVEHVGLLTKKTTVSEEIRNLIIARSASDLMTLCGFLEQYKPEISSIFNKYNKKTKVPDVINDLGSFYYKKQMESAVIMPEIYQHRIQRTLGI